MADATSNWFKTLGLNGPIRNFEQMSRICDRFTKQQGPVRLVLACAEDAKLIEAVQLARARGWILPTLVGSKSQIEKLASKINVQISGWELVDRPDCEGSLQHSVGMLIEDRADVLMRGSVPAAEFLKAVLKHKKELGVHRLLTQVSCFELSNYHKLLLMSDAAVVIRPNFEQKIMIIENAVSVANALGIQLPKVALIAAVEVVNPSMPVAMENAILAKMGDRGQIRGALIDGPLAIDVATFSSAARIKRVNSPVAGDADILIMNKIEEGNILYKSLIKFAKAKTGSVIVGSSKPMIITSRAEVHQNELHSISLAILLHFHFHAT